MDEAEAERRRERGRAANRRWRAAHPDADKARYEATGRAYAKAYYQLNRERILAARAERFKNPEVRQAKREYEQRNKAQISEKSRVFNRHKNYGMTEAVFQEIWENQQGLCAICQRPMIIGKVGNDGVCVDHDHQTGAYRGLLCSRCNLGLGKFADSPETLTRAAYYLTAHRVLPNEPHSS